MQQGSEAAAVRPVSLAERVLVELVQTPSVNPGVFEAAMAERVAGWLRPTGAEVRFVETLPGRPSVAARLDGSGDGPTLVLNGHMDTVPVDDADRWARGPFEGAVVDGFLYGRGACDMKAGLAAQIAVAHAVAQAPERLRGTLVLHFAVGEECGEPGTRSLCEAGFVGDVGIVTEPTELAISVATRGLVTIRIRIRGRSIHASRAERGSNPVDSLGSVLDAVAGYRASIMQRSHPLLGSGSCTPTVVRAGVKENAVADFCDVHLDRRLIPGEDIDAELNDIVQRLEPLRSDDPDLDFEVSHAPYPYEPADVGLESAFAARMREIAGRALGEPPALIGTAYSSDVRILVNEAGMDAVTFGPGNVAECHCVDERVSVHQLLEAQKAIEQVVFEVLR